MNYIDNTMMNSDVEMRDVNVALTEINDLKDGNEQLHSKILPPIEECEEKEEDELSEEKEECEVNNLKHGDEQFYSKIVPPVEELKPNLHLKLLNLKKNAQFQAIYFNIMIKVINQLEKEL